MLVDEECSAEFRGCLVIGNAAELGGAFCMHFLGKALSRGTEADLGA